jgi:hypothetical protein
MTPIDDTQLAMVCGGSKKRDEACGNAGVALADALRKYDGYKPAKANQTFDPTEVDLRNAVGEAKDDVQRWCSW